VEDTDRKMHVSSTPTEVVGARTETVEFSNLNNGLQIGYNKGHIVVNHQYQRAYFDSRKPDGIVTDFDFLDEEIEKAEPCSTLPFEKDEDFIGRESILKEIESQLSPGSGQHRRVVLVGQGGVGFVMLPPNAFPRECI
jgi:hypothetical protein